MRTLLFVLNLIALSSPATAQSVRFAVGAHFDPAALAVLTVDLRELRSGDTTAALHFGVGERIVVGLDLRRTETFGPLGNVSFEVSGRLRTDAHYQGQIGARGVIGPLALNLQLSAFDAPPETFEAGAAARETRPVSATGQIGFGVEIEGDIRADRDVVISVAPDLYLIDGRFAARLQTQIALLRLLPEIDGTLAVHGYASPGFERGHAALGVGAVWRRRRAPVWSGTAWLGIGPTFAAGISARVAQRLGGGALLTADLAVQPYRRDIAPYRLAAGLSLPLAHGTLDISGSAALGGELVAGAQIGYLLPLEDIR